MPNSGSVPAAAPARRHTALCREGVYYLLALGAALTFAMLREANLLIVFCGLFLGLFLAAWRLGRVTLRSLEVSLHLRGHLFAEEPLPVSVELRNPRRRLASWAVVLESSVARDDAHHEKPQLLGRVFFAHVPRLAVVRQSLAGPALKRGRYRLCPVKLWTRFPFGVFRHSLTAREDRVVTVYPQLGRLSPRWTARYRQALLGTRGGGRPGRMLLNDFYGVREWQKGDSLRWVHWRTSARRGTPVVRQHEQNRNCDLTVLVDLWVPPQPSAEDLRQVELAVSFAATVIAQACRDRRARVKLGVTGSPMVWVSGPASRQLLEHALEQLAVVQAALTETLDELVRHAAPRAQASEQWLTVTTRTGAAALAGGAAAAGNRDSTWSVIARRGEIVSTVDPEFTTYFELGPQPRAPIDEEAPPQPPAARAPGFTPEVPGARRFARPQASRIVALNRPERSVPENGEG